VVLALAITTGAGKALVQPHPTATESSNDDYVDGSVSWKATNYRLDNGSGIIFDGSGRRIQIYLGENADLVDLAADSAAATKR